MSSVVVCALCKNLVVEDDKATCKAFPEGIPTKYLYEVDVMQIEECNNGFKFEDRRKQAL